MSKQALNKAWFLVELNNSKRYLLYPGSTAVNYFVRGIRDDSKRKELSYSLQWLNDRYQWSRRLSLFWILVLKSQANDSAEESSLLRYVSSSLFLSNDSNLNIGM